MALLKNVELKINQIEGFKVTFVKNGRNVHANLEDIPPYPYMIAAQDNWTVQEWKQKRFSQKYPGYDVRVYDKNGILATGQKTLAKVRGKERR